MLPADRETRGEAPSPIQSGPQILFLSIWAACGACDRAVRSRVRRGVEEELNGHYSNILRPGTIGSVNQAQEHRSINYIADCYKHHHAGIYLATTLGNQSPPQYLASTGSLVELPS